MKGERVWKGTAVALAVFAVAATLNTWLSASRHREILSVKETDLEKIRTYADRWAAEDALRADLEKRRAWAPADLGELAIPALGADAAKVAPRPATVAAGGWLRREVAVELPDVSCGEAAAFLAAAAETDPPWRLREIEIRPSAAAGKAAMSLVLESLEKKSP